MRMFHGSFRFEHCYDGKEREGIQNNEGKEQGGCSFLVGRHLEPLGSAEGKVDNDGREEDRAQGRRSKVVVVRHRSSVPVRIRSKSRGVSERELS